MAQKTIHAWKVYFRNETGTEETILIYSTTKAGAEELAWVYLERRAPILVGKTKCIGEVDRAYLRTGHECLFCGAPAGHGGLPCPELAVGDSND